MFNDAGLTIGGVVVPTPAVTTQRDVYLKWLWAAVELVEESKPHFMVLTGISSGSIKTMGDIVLRKECFFQFMEPGECVEFMYDGPRKYLIEPLLGYQLIDDKRGLFEITQLGRVVLERLS